MIRNAEPCPVYLPKPVMLNAKMQGQPMLQQRRMVRQCAEHVEQARVRAP